MFFFVFSWEKRVAYIQLVEDASEAPHVNGCIVRNAKHNLRCSVEATLDIGIDLLVFKAATAEVDDLDSALVDLAEQNVLGFQVAVHNQVFPHEVERDQDLDGEPLDQRQTEALEVVHLDEVVQVD